MICSEGPGESKDSHHQSASGVGGGPGLRDSHYCPHVLRVIKSQCHVTVKGTVTLEKMGLTFSNRSLVLVGINLPPCLLS